MKSAQKSAVLIAVLATMFCAATTSLGAAYIEDYGVYKVEARITGDDTHPSLTKIDSKDPGLWSTDANAYVSDSYGTVSSSWSISPHMDANEAQVNIDTSYQVYGTGGLYRDSYAGHDGEVQFNYHSDAPFTVNYYWDMTWGIYPSDELQNWFAQAVRLRIYDSGGVARPDIGVPPTNAPYFHPWNGRYTGSTQINLGADDWLFIVFTSGSRDRSAGEWETRSGNVYLDFDGGHRLTDVDFNHDGSVNMVDYSFFAQTWLLSAGQDGYLEVCDLVNDDVIDLNDLRIFLEFWLD